MTGTVAPTVKSLEDHVPLVGRETVDELRLLAKPLRGLKVLNLSVTAFGTGVAELLRCSVPLLNDLGLDMRWQVVRADDETTSVNKQMYRALAGGEIEWTEQMAETWRRYIVMNAGLLHERVDIVVVHDPQPAALRDYVERSRKTHSHWIMHSHMDWSCAQEDVWYLLRHHLQGYDTLVFEDGTFIPDDLQSLNAKIIPPAIDPLGPRNMQLSEEAVASILHRYGIDNKRPLIAQIAPISRECDALGAVEAYRRVKKEAPELQLVLLATSVPDDLPAHLYFEEVIAEVADEPDIHVLSRLDDIGNVEVNVVQRAAKVVMQRSLLRGFGIWLSDALWKERPVVAAPTGGVPRQIIDKKTGFLAKNGEEFADRVSALVKDPGLAKRIGSAGHRHVTDHFLVTRYLGDYLRLLQELPVSNG